MSTQEEPSIDAYFVGLDLYHITGGKRGYPLNKAVEYAEAYIKSLLEQSVIEEATELFQSYVRETKQHVESATVKEKRKFAVHMRNEGYSLSQIQKAMGLKHKSNVQYLLHSTNNSLEEK